MSQRIIPVYGSVSDLTERVSVVGLGSDVQVNSALKTLCEGVGSLRLTPDDQGLDFLSKDICFLMVDSGVTEETVLTRLRVERAPVDVDEDPDDDEQDDNNEYDDISLDEIDLFDSLSDDMTSSQSYHRIRDSQMRIVDIMESRDGIEPVILPVTGVLSRMLPDNADRGYLVVQGLHIREQGGEPVVEYAPDAPVILATPFYRFIPEPERVIMDASGTALLVANPAASWFVESFTPSIVTLLTMSEQGPEMRCWYFHCDSADGMSPDVCREVLTSVSEHIDIPEDMTIHWAADLSATPLSMVEPVFPTEVASSLLEKIISDEDDEDE